MKTTFDFSGNNFLVTGASSGIGLATVKSLLTAGAAVLGISRHATAVAEKFTGYNFVAADVDVTDEEAVRETLDGFVANRGCLSGCVYAAGQASMLPVKVWHSAKINELLSVNVVAAMTLLKLTSSRKYSLDKASHVFISSVSAHRGEPALGAYSATKGAVEAMVKTAALELAKRGGRVNSACFGWLPTNMTADTDSVMNGDVIPLGAGTTDDAAGLILFLLSEKARWITGANIVMDGGYLVS